MGSSLCTAGKAAVFVAAFLIYTASRCRGQGPVISVDLDPASRKDVAEKLWGVFFEEINHAGEGGIWGELVNDRSFEGTAYYTDPGFLLENDTRVEMATSPSDWPRVSEINFVGTEFGQHFTLPLTWQVDGGNLTLTKDQPLNTNGPNTTVALKLEGGQTVANYGFWGIPVNAGSSYELTYWVNNQNEGVPGLTIELQSSDGSQSLSDAPPPPTAMPQGKWSKQHVTLTASAANYRARLAVTAAPGTSVLLDQVSLWPSQNGPEGSISPFRPDLIQMVRDLNPRTLRIPGGCFVEGSLVDNAWKWQWSIGPPELRRGQENYWQYWVTNGLGIKEYLDLSELLGVDMNWAINIGNTKGDNNNSAAQYTPEQVRASGWFEDQMNQVDFILASSGPMADLRASLGHPEPYNMSLLALGNEDCGRPTYVDNYKLFYGALASKYPQLQFVSNCDITIGPDALAPLDQQIIDYHFYPGFPQYPEDPQNAAEHMFGSWNMWRDPSLLEAQAVLDGRGRGVYVSEYATWDTKITTWPSGNLKDAIADAAFKIGMERVPEIVKMAAYAPLFSNSDQVGSCCPENAIIFDNHRTLKDPAYHVEQLFSSHQGKELLNTTFNFDTTYGQAQQYNITASATCQDVGCTHLAVKVVNFWPEANNATVCLNGSQAVDPSVQRIVLTGPDPYGTNTYDNPNVISPLTDVIHGGQQIHVQLPPYSLTILLVNLGSEDHPQAPASPALPQSANYSGQLLPLTSAPMPSPPPPPQLQQSPPGASRTEPTQASASTVPQLPALQRLGDAVASVFIG